jgi:hypothetical protein
MKEPHPGLGLLQCFWGGPFPGSKLLCRKGLATRAASPLCG